MDQNELYDQIMQHVEEVLVRGEDVDLEDFARSIMDLDEWLRRGGALPEPWER